MQSSGINFYSLTSTALLALPNYDDFCINGQTNAILRSDPGSRFRGVIVRLDQSVFTISGNLRMAKPVSSFTSEMAKDSRCSWIQMMMACLTATML